MKTLNLILNITRRTIRFAVLTGIALAFTFDSNVHAQTPQQLLNEIDGAVTETVQPFTDMMSSSMNSGMFSTAKVENGFKLYVGVKAAGTLIAPEIKKQYGLEKFQAIPFAVPQLEIGAAGTDIFVRYLPSIKFGEYGSAKFMGFGVRHCVTSHFENSPVDISVQGAYQKLNYSDKNGNDILNASSMVFNLQVSKELGFVTIYTGAQYESTEATVGYNFNNLVSISKKFENQNKFRATVGINVGLGPINVNADYNFGKTQTISAGFGLGF